MLELFGEDLGCLRAGLTSVAEDEHSAGDREVSCPSLASPSFDSRLARGVLLEEVPELEIEGAVEAEFVLLWRIAHDDPGRGIQISLATG